MSEFQSFLDQALKNVEIPLNTFESPKLKYNIYSDIAQQLSRARNAAGLSQKELAVRSGLTQANISKIESGISHPTIDSIQKIADVLGKRVIFRLADQEDLEDYD